MARGRQRRFRPIFSPAGFIVFIISLVILIRSLLNRNPYEIVIASVVLFLMLVLFVIGMWKSRKLKNAETGWKPPFPMTANAGEDTQITDLDASIPLFFRLHFLARGQFFPCGAASSGAASSGAASSPSSQGGAASRRGGCRVSVETSIPRNDTSARMLLDFPISGVFYGEGFCQLRDIFGFFTFACGHPQKKTLNVRSAPCYGKQTYINAQSGAEDRRNKPASDVERYHMREYTPGDRFRDINWKSSDKIDTLITRISTDNQEKISRIEVHLRNFTSVSTVLNISRADVNVSHGVFSLEALWLLDRAKSRLAYFLRTLMEQNSSFIFDVRTANSSYEIENMDDLDAFLEELAGVSFMPLRHEAGSAPGAGDIYVFSTACDFGLSSFLLANSQRPVTLFLLQPPDKTLKADVETLRISHFSVNGCAPPARWYLPLRAGRSREKIKPLKVHAGKTEMFYAEVKA